MKKPNPEWQAIWAALPEEERERWRSWGREGGKKAAANRAKWSPEERTQRARKMAAGRKPYKPRQGPVSYYTGHQRVRRMRGTPQSCEECGTNDPAKKYQWANLTGNFGDPLDYKRMCVPCHKKMDVAKAVLVRKNKLMDLLEKVGRGEVTAKEAEGVLRKHLRKAYERKHLTPYAAGG